MWLMIPYVGGFFWALFTVYFLVRVLEFSTAASILIGWGMFTFGYIAICSAFYKWGKE